jgi:hypothetical protein
MAAIDMALAFFAKALGAPQPIQERHSWTGGTAQANGGA